MGRRRETGIYGTRVKNRGVRLSHCARCGRECDHWVSTCNRVPSYVGVRLMVENRVFLVRDQQIVGTETRNLQSIRLCHDCAEEFDDFIRGKMTAPPPAEKLRAKTIRVSERPELGRESGLKRMDIQRGK